MRLASSLLLLLISRKKPPVPTEGQDSNGLNGDELLLFSKGPSECPKESIQCHLD